MKDREPNALEEQPSAQSLRGAPVGLDPSPDGGKAPNWPEGGEIAAAFPPKKLTPKPLTVAAMLVVAVVGVILILFAWGLWPFASNILTTDNSFIRGKITVLSSQVSGYVVEVPARDYTVGFFTVSLLRLRWPDETATLSLPRRERLRRFYFDRKSG